MQATKMKRDQRSECEDCGSRSEGLLLILHNVRRGPYRRLCSNCILKIHPGLFCPICLQVYDPSPPPPPVRRICFKCPSICHLACASSSSSSSFGEAASSSFLCPPCSNPNFAFFSVSSGSKKFKVNGNDNDDVNGDSKRIMDAGSAKALVAAAKIAALSMSKAAAVARVEAEKRVKEAAFAKKRAREALERLLYLAAEEKKGKSMRPHSGGVAGNNNNNNNNNGGGRSSNGLYFQRQEANNHGMGK